MQEPRDKEPTLAPEDFDHALRRMKTDLALLGLRRELLSPDLDARQVLALTDRIVALQRETRIDRNPRGVRKLDITSIGA